ncbi:MAG: TraB/GumN family protein [Desulfococcaceae bacterium]|jgi:pheromone shutdown-related protein TraB|nr:TraB/GumN family protein [Desulfococcaceae bacterium]
MEISEKKKNTDRLSVGEKEIILLGTAHVSKESVELVKRVIEEEKPDTVCVELCESRYQAIRQKDQWQNTDIVKVIREKKAFLLLSNLMLASFQRRIASKLEIKPGQEMLTAMEKAEEYGAQIHLADRDIRATLSRTWRKMSFWDKMKILFQMILSFGDIGDISEEDIEKMKQQDILEALLADVGKSLPVLKHILIDERDEYLAARIRSAPGQKIVAVVGAGHVPGIKKNWEKDIDLKKLEEIPPKGTLAFMLKWVFPLLILFIFVAGFSFGGAKTGADMAVFWIAANGILAGLGALIALAHPLTILSAVLAAPLTSLNPMMAAGWVSGLTEAFLRRPRVKDFENLTEDIVSVRGFWRNKVTRILLVVVFTNLGSSAGTFIAIPLMVKMLH